MTINERIAKKHAAKSKGRGRGRRTEPPVVTDSDVRAWFAGNLPDDWFTEPVDVRVDRDEILVTGSLAVPVVADGDDIGVATSARIAAFREETREQRMAIADRAQHTFQRTVSWAARCGDVADVFTQASVPVMTRLHMEDRQVLDTLIDAGVARSRSEAMAWCVRLVGENESEWIDSLRSAMEDVERLRHEGPSSAKDSATD